MTASNRICFHAAAVIVASLSSPANAQDALGNLWVTVPLETIAPGTSHDLGIIWDGGEPPWSWTLEISQLDDPDQVFFQTGLSETVCDNPADRLRCRSFPIPTSFRWPEIATITATVEDAAGNLVTRTVRVRVAGDGTFWFDGRWTVDVVEEEFGPGFDCFGFNNQDPPLVTLTGDPAFPVIDVFKDERLSSPHELIVRDEKFFSFPEPAETLYHIRNDDFDINENPFENVLPFPLRYGDLDLLFDSPISLLSDSIPAPALRTHRMYSIDLRGYQQCNFPPTDDARFMLNPPAPGDPVVVRGPVDEVDVSDPEFLNFLEFIAAGSTFRVDPGQQAIAGCVDKQLGLQVLSVLTAGAELGKAFPIETGAASVFLLLTDPDNMDRLKNFCADNLMAPTTFLGDEPPAVQAASTTDFDLEIVSGSSRISLAEPTLLTEVRTAHASVIVSDALLEIAQAEDGRRSAIGSPDSQIVVTPNNPGLAETSIPAGFFVILSDTSVSAPIEFALFADGFE